MKNINQFTQEYKEWLNKLIFIQDEFRYFNNKLNYLMTINVKKPIRQQAAQFKGKVEGKILYIEEMQQTIEAHISAVNILAVDSDVFLEGHENKRKTINSIVDSYKETKSVFENMVMSLGHVDNNYIS
ncbi:hypothetical protein R9C00_27735 [Flammeovirgaceae bacterium SG7u.111]|nr:hypothetical protein [Flammeovirgaceae bacterium SG7u.132]WPO35493.1 hypothetical protein R9C00_27735 [Flammeovirgaceae bacterium SG7u.111]